MSPLKILIIAEAALLAFGVATLVPAYAATPADDGVTVLTAPAAPAAPAQPATAPMEQIRLSDGDSITAPAGTAITTAMDPKTGDFTTVIMGAGQ